MRKVFVRRSTCAGSVCAIGASLTFFLLAAPQVQAQFTLSGTNYTQSFDSVGTGLPTGWDVRTGATATALGTAATFITTQALWSATTGQFANFASADGLTSTATTAQQNASTDRVIGLRQTGTFGDPGAAVDFNFNASSAIFSGAGTALSFSLQMLSVQTRSTTFSIQYGVGVSPSAWTTLGTYSDPATFGSTPFTFTGTQLSALSGQSNAWLRVVALSASTGSGSRDTIGLDDLSFTYTAVVVADNIYFDINGTTSGSGNPASSYNFSGATWNSAADGTAAPGTFTDGKTATFAAGTDGTGTYTVKVDTAVTTNGLSFEEGTVTLDHAAGGALTLTGASINVASGAAAVISEAVGGTVGLTKDGAGLLTLSGANGYTGTTTINAGTLSISSDGNLGNTSNGIALGGGALQATVDISLAATRTLNGSGSLDVAPTKTLTFNGTVGATTPGALTFSNTGTTVFANATTNAATSLTFSAAGTFNVTGAALSLPGNITTTHASGTATVSGNINFGSGTRNVTVGDGSAATDLLLSANLSGASVLVKLGAGTLALTGNNSGLTGTGTIPASIRQGAAAVAPTTGGTISVNNANALGTGQLQLNGGTLRNDSGAALVFTNTNGISTGAQDHTNTPGGLIFAGNNGSASLEFTGQIQLFKATGGNYQHYLTANTPTTFSGAWIASTGSGTSTGVTIAGSSSLTLSGGTANTFAEPVTIAGTATLIAAKTGALGANTAITINTGGTLLLSGASTNKINDSSAVTLAGGAIKAGNSLTEQFGTLTLTADSVIDFGISNPGSTLTFADSSALSSFWISGKVLSIWNWTAEVDHLYFGSNPSGLTSSQLSQITFYSDAGSTLANGFSGAAFNGSPFDGLNGEISPVPEPSTVAVAMGLLGLVGWRERRKSSLARQATRLAVV